MEFAKTMLIGTLAFLVCGCKGKDNTMYAPGFSEEAMQQVSHGMTTAQVWELLGNPFECRGPFQGSDEFVWEYSCLATSSHGTVHADGKEYVSHISKTVRFNHDGIVIGISSNKSSTEKLEHLEATIDAMRNSVRSVGNLRLERKDGTVNELDAADSGVHVILLDRGCSDGSCSINNGPAWFSAEKAKMMSAGTIKAVHHLHIGEHHDAYQGVLDAQPAADKQHYYTSTEPHIDLTVRDQDSGMLLYSSGTLFSVHSIHMVGIDDNGQPIFFDEHSALQHRLILSLSGASQPEWEETAESLP
jgi:outer membrane protein assembly factor BamE (lipoprotein component of BamABCDE complex)